VAHGFASLTDLTLWYLVDGYYNPEDELGVAWDDPAIAGDWGLTDPVLSTRDQANPLRSEIPAGRQPYLGLRT
jgi:dTDP-4-dehydrorhamnose 3,5-epimerase